MDIGRDASRIVGDAAPIHAPGRDDTVRAIGRAQVLIRDACDRRLQLFGHNSTRDRDALGNNRLGYAVAALASLASADNEGERKREERFRPAPSLRLTRSVDTTFTCGRQKRTVNGVPCLTRMMKSVKLQPVHEALLSVIGGLGPISYLTKEEVEDFFSAIPRSNIRDRLMFDLIYRHGLRRKEAALICLENIMPDGKIWIQRVKGGVSGTYSVHPVTRRLLAAYLRERRLDGCRYLLRGIRHRADPLSGGLIYLLFRRYATAAGIAEDRRHTHVLRHSIAVHMMNAGLDVADVQDWLGHRAITSTLVYARISNKRRERNYERIISSSEVANTTTAD